MGFPMGFPMVSPGALRQGPHRNLAELTAMRLDVLRLCQGAAATGGLQNTMVFLKGIYPLVMTNIAMV